jgi:hypothetical protein
MTTQNNNMPKHLLGIFGRELYARIVELSENGADYAETVEILKKEHRIGVTCERNIYNLYKSWGLL